MSLRVNKQANEVLAKSLQTSCEFKKKRGGGGGEGKKIAHPLIPDLLFWDC